VLELDAAKEISPYAVEFLQLPIHSICYGIPAPTNTKKIWMGLHSQSS